MTESQITKFPIGQLFVSLGVSKLLPLEEISGLLRRHATADWGDIDETVSRENDSVIAEQKGTLLSSYTIEEDEQIIWVHTDLDRSATTILLPNEFCEINAN